LNQDGGLKIGDLGISKSIQKITQNTTNFPGTANYMSPEIINEERDYTNKVDVWALGCVACELITLQKLFDDATEFKIKSKIISGDISIPNVDSNLKNILQG
jgi:serine/threonine protein kinase